MTRTLEDRVLDVRLWLRAARAVYDERARLTASIAAGTGLSPQGVRLGFESLEVDATPDGLHALVASAGSAAHVHVILSANVFVAPLRALAIARAAAPRVTVRPSSRDPTLTGALVAAAGDPAVSLAVDRDRIPAEADRIDVYGRDETIARVRGLARPGVAVRGHGAGLGVAFVARTTMVSLEGPADALAADVIPFDQRGCLSPRIAFVEGPPQRGEAFAFALHEALDRRGTAVPRGTLAKGERADAARWRETLAFAGQVWLGDDHLVGLIARPNLALRLVLPPAGRHVLVVPVESALEARDLLAPIARFVVNVGLLDPDPACVVVPPHARVAPLGTMQRPPLDGPVDRRSL